MPDQWRGSPTDRRAQFVATVAADGVHRPGGHGESLGWVLADLAAGWPLRHDYGPLTAAVTGRPDVARALVEAAGFVPTRIDYDGSQPDGRYVRWQHTWVGTAGELWDSTTGALG